MGASPPDADFVFYVLFPVSCRYEHANSGAASFYLGGTDFGNSPPWRDCLLGDG